MNPAANKDADEPCPSTGESPGFGGRLRSAPQPDALASRLEVAAELLRVAAEAENPSEAVADLIFLDRTLSEDLLLVCRGNGFRQIAACHPAGQVAGVFRVALAALVMTCARKRQHLLPYKENFWRHCLAAGLGAEVIGSYWGENWHESFAAGLLHDIGKLAMAEEFGADYGRLLQLSARKAKPLFPLENKLLHLNHGSIGGRLLGEAGFPEKVAVAVAFHHAPENCFQEHRQLARIVAGANALTSQLPGCHWRKASREERRRIQDLGFGGRDQEQIVQQVSLRLHQELVWSDRIAARHRTMPPG